MPKIIQLYVFCCCAIILLCVSVQQGAKPFFVQDSFLLPDIATNFSESANTRDNIDKQPILTHTELLHNDERTAHASALVATDSQIMALFYAGTREGATDVKIYQSFFDLRTSPTNAQRDEPLWSVPKVLLTPEMLSKFSGRFIKKVGNPIVFKDSRGRIHLFVVGVSLGGWATSRIYQFRFHDDLRNLVYVRELHLNPFANYSHLVRTPPIMLNQGGFILAFSHEMWHKFPLIALFDESGAMQSVRRLNDLNAQLQPSLIALTPDECAAFYRTNNRYNTHTYYQTCTHHGNEWNAVQQSNVNNFDSSLLLVNLGAESILIMNDGKSNPQSPNPNGDRITLSIYWLRDRERGVAEHIYTIDVVERCDIVGCEVSYPAATIAQGTLYVSYTYNRKTIKYAALNIDSLLHEIEKRKHANMEGRQSQRSAMRKDKEGGQS